MREILFRGKNKYNNEWVYGQLTIGNNYNFIITKEDYDDVVASLQTLVCQCHPVEKTPNTIGQYTGLTDKNGKKIFEGDIIKNSNGQLYTIRYICGGFDCEPIKEFYRGYKITWNTLGEIQNASWCESNCEIIGNIWDNPEMIKENEDD